MSILTCVMSREGSSRWMAAWIAPERPNKSPYTIPNLPLAAKKITLLIKNKSGNINFNQ